MIAVDRCGYPDNTDNVEIFYGIVSNIPLCCVLYYDSIWHRKGNTIRPIIRAAEHTQLKVFPADYVVCPDCIISILERKTHAHKLNMGKYKDLMSKKHHYSTRKQHSPI